MIRKLAISALAALSLTNCSAVPTSAPRDTHTDLPNTTADPTRPNIVLILLDDLGFSDIGAYGSEIQTPAMDALVAEGKTFSQFYVYPRCSPTRAALMTGMYPHQAGLGVLAAPEHANIPVGPYQGYLDKDLDTLAELLRDAGYDTYMSGKWHLGEAPEHWPRKHGFDRYFGLISGASSYYELIEDQPRKRRMALDDDSWTPPESDFFMTDAITDYALKYLQDHQGSGAENPFFLYLAYTAPHWPLHASEDDIAMYDGVYDAGWEQIAEARRLRGVSKSVQGSANSVHSVLGPWEDYPDKQEWQRRMQTHAAMVTAADRGIGEVVEKLRGTGDLENTLILVLSDNGASAEDVAFRGLHDPATRTGERGSYVSFGAPGAIVANAPLREYKGSVFEGGVRSPLIAYWKGKIEPSDTDTQSVFSVVDIPTSLMALSDTALPIGVEGADLSDVLLGNGTADEKIFLEHTGWRAVRDGDLKAISAPGESTWQLYDLSSDPAETVDISAQHPEETDRLKQSWLAWSERVGATPLPMEVLMRAFAAEDEQTPK